MCQRCQIDHKGWLRVKNMLNLITLINCKPFFIQPLKGPDPCTTSKAHYLCLFWEFLVKRPLTLVGTDSMWLFSELTRTGYVDHCRLIMYCSCVIQPLSSQNLTSKRRPNGQLSIKTNLPSLQSKAKLRGWNVLHPWISRILYTRITCMTDCLA